IEADMDPVGAASRMDTDEIVGLGELRSWLELLADCSYQSFGYRRTKNPRIWSLHDLTVLGSAPLPSSSRELQLDGDVLTAPTVGTLVWRATAGTVGRPGDRLAILERAGARVELVVPSGTN